MRLLIGASCALLMLAVAAETSAQSGSIQFSENRPTDYAFLDLPAVPPEFGVGEFSFELWIKPDDSFPVGPVWRGAYNQLRNWSEADPEPYSTDGWWLAGNWLLDGHTRPRGFSAGDSREGTFSLQFYGGGRLRWMFADSSENMPRGMVHAVQAWPAQTTPSLLDGRWHHVVAVRRWREPAGATLELWIDGEQVARTDIPLRKDMQTFWKSLPHPEDPPELGGWSFGAEVMTAWGQVFTQYEDYKGLMDDVRFWGRALDPSEIRRIARGGETSEIQGVLAHFPFSEGEGNISKDALGSGLHFKLMNARPHSWSSEDRSTMQTGG